MLAFFLSYSLRATVPLITHDGLRPGRRVQASDAFELPNEVSMLILRLAYRRTNTGSDISPRHNAGFAY
jgi:hypothetical protein